MYENDKSIYCYPGSDVLKNIPNFMDQAQLDSFERLVTTERLTMLDLYSIVGQFDLNHLFSIHHFIFQDVYPFAGQLRTEDIGKDNFRFATSIYLEENCRQLFEELRRDNFLHGLNREDFLKKLTYYMTELNVLHPFREGNGRTLREFFRCLSNHAGYEMNWNKVKPNIVLRAMILSPTNPGLLHKILHTIVS